MFYSNPEDITYKEIHTYINRDNRKIQLLIDNEGNLSGRILDGSYSTQAIIKGLPKRISRDKLKKFISFLKRSTYVTIMGIDVWVHTRLRGGFDPIISLGILGFILLNGILGAKDEKIATLTGTVAALEERNTALHKAVMQRNEAEVRHLLNENYPFLLRPLLPKPNVNAVNLEGNTPLRLAVLNGDRRIIGILRMHGAHDSASDDDFLRVPNRLLPPPTGNISAPG